MRYLEEKNCEFQLEAGWIHRLMIDIGIPALKILELYDRMFKSRVGDPNFFIFVCQARISVVSTSACISYLVLDRETKNYHVKSMLIVQVTYLCRYGMPHKP